MRRCQLGSFCIILVCLRKIWKYKHRLWLLLIIDGFWRRDKAFKNKDKGIYQLTFRFVVARPWLRNLLLGNVCKRNVSVRIGNTGNTFMVGRIARAYLCPYSDLWASCRVYLYRETEILAFYYKIKSFCAFIYLYIRKFLRFRLSCKWASFLLAFAVKSYTLVYFVSKASLLIIVTPLRRFLHLQWCWHLTVTLLRLWSSGVQRFYDARGQHLNFMPPPPPTKKESFMKNTKPMEIYEINLSFKLHIN